MARHGLILCQHGATACMDLLEALLAPYRSISGPFWGKLLDFGGTWVWGAKKHAKNIQLHMIFMKFIGFRVRLERFSQKKDFYFLVKQVSCFDIQNYNQIFVDMIQPKPIMNAFESLMGKNFICTY